MKYATAVTYPGHLAVVAVQNAGLIGEIVAEASRLLASRCKGNAQIGACVAIALSTLVQEYESGEHTKVEDFDFKRVAERNAEATKSPEQIVRVIEEGRSKFGADRLERMAVAMYEARRRMTPANPQTGEVFPKWDDERVWESTRDQYRWASVIALEADAS